MLATDSLPHIGRIAERHPGLRLTIDHLGGRGGNTTLTMFTEELPWLPERDKYLVMGQAVCAWWD
jgi:hypothetical protein